MGHQVFTLLFVDRDGFNLEENAKRKACDLRDARQPPTSKEKR